MSLNIKDQLTNFKASGIFTVGYLIHREGIALDLSLLALI